MQPKSLRCRIGWHSIGVGVDFEPSFTAPIVTCFRVSERCVRCGKGTITETHYDAESGRETEQVVHEFPPR